MKAYRSRLARVLDPARNLVPRTCPGPAQMIPDVAIHDPWPERLGSTWQLQATEKSTGPNKTVLWKA